MLSPATILRDYGSSPVADPGEGARGPAPRYFWNKMRPEGRKKFFFETAPPPLLSEGLDPPLQSNNRSQKFLLVLTVVLVSSGSADRSASSACSKIKLLILARFLAYIIFFHLPVSGLKPMNVLNP